MSSDARHDGAGGLAGRAGLTGLFATLTLVTAVLHAAGSGSLSGPPLTQPDQWERWLAERDPVVATMALFRLIALVVAWYLVATAAVGGVLRLLRAVRLVSIV
ncbi:MAG: hypothetical protein M3314_12915, partial [Actinomycetota bacterium]|nr:hypothetical protein [Actinomycetota bacterium]